MKKEKNKCSCIICKKEVHVRGFDTHWKRIHGTDEERSKFKNCGANVDYKKVASTMRNKHIALQTQEAQQYSQNPRLCMKCGSAIPFSKRNNKNCSRKCANARVVSLQTRVKISRSALQNSKKRREVLEDPPEFYSKQCRVCNKTFITKSSKKTCCSTLCRYKARGPRLNKSKAAICLVRRYRALCKFKFSLKLFPDEFDFSLVEKYGWYKAANRGNNPGGVSRDHMVSVKYGLDNGIDPSIISHPANCQLLTQPENFKKREKCSITIDELILRISEWDRKYNTEKMEIGRDGN